MLIYRLFFRISALFTHEYRYKILKSLLYYDQKFYDKPSSSAAILSSNLGRDCEQISKVAGPVLGMQLLLVSSIVIAIIISSTYDIVLTIVISCFVPFIGFTKSRSSAMLREGMVEGNLEATTTIASDSLTNIKTVHSLRQQNNFREKYLKAAKNEKSRRLKVANWNGIHFGLVYCLTLFLWGTQIWVGGKRVEDKELDMDEMLLVLFTMVYSTWSFIIVSVYVSDVEGGINSVKNMFKIMDYKQEIDANSNQGLMSDIKGDVEFINIFFKYDNRDVIVINNLNFALDADRKSVV